MAEILTESFCERCGTRYTFESPARRANPLGALGTVGRGLRNFVASPDQSIDEAFAVARAENEQKATAHQLEAFHQTFNFCLSCRQYTCGTCWNPVEGRCQSCAPMPEAEMLPAAEVGADAPVVAEAMAIARATAVPVIELPPSAEDGIRGLDWPEVDSRAAEPPEPEAEATAEAEPIAEPEPLAEAEPLTSLAVEDLDVAVPAFEVESEPEAIVEAEPEAVAEPEVEAEAVQDSAPEVAAIAEPATEFAPEPEADAPRRRSTSLPAFPPGVSLDDEIAAYDLRVAALAEPEPPVAMPSPVASPVAPMPAAEPELYRPAAIQPSVTDAAPEARSALPPVYVAGAVPELPEASPVALPAAQTTGSCASCGLTLSATARFCRRCGTPQHAA